MTLHAELCRRAAWVLGQAILTCIGLVLVLLPVNTHASTPLKLRIVGGLAGVNQYVQHEEPFWSQELARLSGGKYSAEIAPFDRSGIPAEEMLRLMSLGVIPFGTAMLGPASAQHPMLGAMDLSGLNPDMASLKRHVASFRPILQKTLREKHGIEVLAVYTYPAQILFCKKSLTSLRELEKRRIRVSSPSQADLIQGLGGVPVLVGFGQMLAHLQAGNTECAITGTMSGNTIGLTDITSHMYNLPFTWGLAVFGANTTAWNALPSDLKALLRKELARLETNIWNASERETADGLACNRGDPSCEHGRPGKMTQINPSPDDIKLVRELVKTTVLPRWQQRCNQHCREMWDSTIGSVPSDMPLPNSR